MTVTNNQATFSSLSDNTEYVAYASSPDRYKKFFTSSPSTTSGSGASVVAAGNLGAAYTLDPGSSKDVILTGTLNANATVTIPPSSGRQVRLDVTQDATGGRTLTISDGTNTQPVTINTAGNAKTTVEVFSPNDTDLVIETDPGTADGSVKARHLSAAARGLRSVDTGAAVTVIARNLPETQVRLSNIAIPSGTLRVVRGVILPGGVTVNKIRVSMGTTLAVTPTNQWACLIRASDRSVLVKSTDNTTAVAAASTMQEFTITGGYTPTDDIEVYVGLVIVAATPPTLSGADNVVATNNIRSTPLVGNCDTGLTNPASLGATAIAVTASTAGINYAELV